MDRVRGLVVKGEGRVTCVIVGDYVCPNYFPSSVRSAGLIAPHEPNPYNFDAALLPLFATCEWSWYNLAAWYHDSDFVSIVLFSIKVVEYH
jgi:hypothetical protein